MDRHRPRVRQPFHCIHRNSLLREDSPVLFIDPGIAANDTSTLLSFDRSIWNDSTMMHHNIHMRRVYMKKSHKTGQHDETTVNDVNYC